MKSTVAVVTALLLMLGILTCWVQDKWALTVFQSGFFLLTAVWLISQLRKYRQMEFHWIIVLCAGVALLGLIQIFLGITVNPSDTLSAVLVWTTHTCVVVLVLYFSTSTRIREPFIEVLLIFATLVSILGIIQNFTSDGKVFWIFDSGYKNLVLGPFVYRNKYAQFIELFLPVALFRAVKHPGKIGSSLVMVAVMLSGSIAIGSRSGVLIAALETITCLFIIRQRGWVNGHRILRIGVQAAILIIICGGVVGWEFLGKRLQQDPADDLRVPIMLSAVDMVREKPLTGFGLGAWDKAYPAFARFDNGLYTNQAHCDWLQWPGEGGIPLLIAMIFLAGLSLKLGIKQPWALGVFFVFLHGLVDYPMQQVPQFSALILAIQALAIGEFINKKRRIGIRELHQ